MRYVCLIPLGLLLLLAISVLAGLLLQLPRVSFPADFSLDEIGFALRLTLMTSGAAVLVAFGIGVPSGYFLARHAFKGKALVETLIDLPMTMTPLVAGVGLLFLLSNGVVHKVLDSMGIGLLFTPLGAVLAQTLIAAPIMARTCRSAFTVIDPRYEQAAQTLGLRPYHVFLRISLPMARPALFSGTVLCWARAVGEFGATLMVAGATRFKTETLPMAVYLNISSGELGLALVCAWLLILTGFLVLMAIRWVGSPLWAEHLVTRTGT